jgi:hypothetical protein
LGKVNNLSDYKGTSYPIAGNSSHLEDNKTMLQNINNPQENDYRKAGYLKRPVRPPKRVELIPDDVMIELEEEIFPHKHLATHRTAGPMAEAARVVKALRKPGGLSNILDKLQIEQIITNLSTGPAKLNPKAIESIIYKQFDDTERIELYQRISDSMSPACGSTKKDKTISLAEAAYAKYAGGFSRLVMVCLIKPVPKVVAMTELPVPAELQKAMEMCKAKMNGKSDHNNILRQLRPMKVHWDANITPKLATLYKTNPSFESWLGDYLKYGYNKATKDHPFHAGWLNPNFWAFQEWEAIWIKEVELESRERQKGDQLRAQQQKAEQVKKAINIASEYGMEALDDPAWGFTPEVIADAKREGQYGYR